VTGLLGPNGRPISSKQFEAKKATAPALGERYGRWAGPEVPFVGLPGGGAIAFDTSTLTLADMRQMRGHYQINSSLSVLTFMMHQMAWHIECDKSKIGDHVGENLENVWTRLIRAQSQSLWAGYSPNALQWDNDVNKRSVVLTKIKDLFPEDCRVHWKKQEVSVPGPKGMPPAKVTHHIYDGIDQLGSYGPIPVENSYWYPLLMENGNYYGRRILESAFQPWFFSILLHLFANRYYERYGEPTPIGRAPFEDEIDVNGVTVKGNQLMATIIQSLRNRSTVILPSSRTQQGDEPNPSFDYELEYLESQMRGADFERYMTRLDEEMSLAMFTPILMMRTADVGSYNLGTQHTQVYQWMLNALSGDWEEYINKYIIRPMVRYNFGDSAPEAKIKFTTLGKTSGELLQAIITELLKGGKIKFDTREIGEMAGLTVTEINEVAPETEPQPKEEKPNPNTDNAVGEVQRLMNKRVREQVTKAFTTGMFGDPEEFIVKMGYKRQMIMAMKRDGIENAEARVTEVYEIMDAWIASTGLLGKAEFASADEYCKFFDAKLDRMLEVFTR
jgi:hypothetical protein